MIDMIPLMYDLMYDSIVVYRLKCHQLKPCGVCNIAANRLLWISYDYEKDKYLCDL